MAQRRSRKGGRRKQSGGGRKRRVGRRRQRANRRGVGLTPNLYPYGFSAAV